MKLYDENGTFVTELKENEYSINKSRINKKFFKLFFDFTDNLLELNLNSNEFKMLMFFIKNIRFESNEVSFRNGKKMDSKNISVSLDISERTVKRIVKKFEKLNIIKFVNRKMYFNPFFASRSEYIYTDTIEYFKTHQN